MAEKPWVIAFKKGDSTHDYALMHSKPHLVFQDNRYEFYCDDGEEMTVAEDAFIAMYRYQGEWDG